MRSAQYIAITAAIIVTLGLYYGANTKPPKQPVPVAQRPAEAAQGQGSVVAANADTIVATAKGKLPQAAADSITAIEKQLTAIRDSSGMAVLFLQVAGILERQEQLPAAAWYRAKWAKLENSEKSLTFAGQLFLQLMEHEHSPSMQLWEAREAIACLEQSQQLNPNNEDTKLALASAYIQGAGEPMKGVQILLAITREKPNDIPANMLLGRMSIQSGQFDKAIVRFETVLKLEPENKEAVYFLAQAYEGKGDKPKAIELLERCKKIVNNPAFSRDIDEHINSLK